MADKDRRQAVLAAVVRRGRVRTQRDLRALLLSHGWRVDQSTLSRDLADLGVRKVGGRYLPLERQTPEPVPGPQNHAAGVRRFTICGPHLIVLQTVIGQAQTIAVAMDAAGEPSIVATLAGDDAVFVATKNRRSQTVALRKLKTWFGEKHDA